MLFVLWCVMCFHIYYTLVYYQTIPRCLIAQKGRLLFQKVVTAPSTFIIMNFSCRLVVYGVFDKWLQSLLEVIHYFHCVHF